MKQKNKLILEFSEFNLQRMNPDSARASVHVDDPQLSTNAFDKFQDAIRQATSRINGILFNLKGTSAYSNLRSKLSLSHQDIKSLKILRINKADSINYDVYISFVINDKEYWGVVRDLLGLGPKFESEVFKDFDLLQPKEWIIKTRGLVIKTLKVWLKPEPGSYKLLNDLVICHSVESGKQLKMEKGIEIELIRAHDDKMIVKYGSEYYNLKGDGHVYFNWWFQKMD